MRHSNKQQVLADLALLTVAVLWGTSFVATKNLLDFMPPFYILGMRFLVASSILAVIFHKKMASVKKADIIAGAVVGTAIFLAASLQTVGLQYTSPGKQAFLAGTYVVMVPFLSWAINKKRPDLRSFIGAGICFFGIALLTLNEKLTIGFGDGLTLVSSMFYAVHILTIGYFISKTDATLLSITQFFFGGLWSISIAVFTERFPADTSPAGWMAFMYLAVFCTCIAYFLQTVAQQFALPTHVAIILSMEAVFGSLFAVLLFGEKFTARMVVGCLCVLGAILLSELRGTPSETVEEQTREQSREKSQQDS